VSASRQGAQWPGAEIDLGASLARPGLARTRSIDTESPTTSVLGIPGSLRALCTLRDTSWHVLETGTGEAVASGAVGGRSVVASAAAVSPGGSLAALRLTISRGPHNEETEIAILDLERGVEAHRFAVSPMAFFASFAPDGTRLELMHHRGVDAYDIERGEHLGRMEHPVPQGDWMVGNVSRVRDDGAVALVREDTSTYAFVDVASGALTMRLRMPHDTSTCGDVRYTPSGRAVVTVRHGATTHVVLDGPTGSLLGHVTVSDVRKAWSRACLLDDRTLCVGSMDGLSLFELPEVV